MSTARKLLIYATLVFGTFACALAIRLAYLHTLNEYRLSLVPDALQVTSIVYVMEESWGFGPGGNETGILVYRLPAATAALAGTGLGFFENMPGNSATAGRRWRGSYSDWKETPIAADERHWPVDSRQQSLSSLDYLCRYGFCIEVAAALIRDVDSLINSPGSYYAYGRIGLIVVSPEKRLVVYLYNG